MENDIIYKMIYKNNKEIPESRDRNIKFISLDKNKKFWKINMSTLKKFVQNEGSPKSKTGKGFYVVLPWNY